MKSRKTDLRRLIEGPKKEKERRKRRKRGDYIKGENDKAKKGQIIQKKV